jgi:hypothetical protein
MINVRPGLSLILTFNYSITQDFKILPTILISHFDLNRGRLPLISIMLFNYMYYGSLLKQTFIYGRRPLQGKI